MLTALDRLPHVAILFLLVLVLLAVYVVFTLQHVQDEVVKSLLIGSAAALLALLNNNRNKPTTEINARVENAEINTGADVK